MPREEVHKPSADEPRTSLTPIKYLLQVDCTIFSVDYVGLLNPMCIAADKEMASLMLQLLGDFHKRPLRCLDALNEKIVDVTA